MVTTAGPLTQLGELNERGWTVLKGVLDPAEVGRLSAEIDRLHRELRTPQGTNGFEGYRTRRIYTLLGRGETWTSLPIHERVLPLVDAVLGPDCLLSSYSAITIDPGENAQPIHADDQIFPVGRPHPPLVLNTMYAVTDFTEENGATRLVPRSHLGTEEPDFGGQYDSVAATMRAGDALVWHGGLFHGGGANRTTASRTGVAITYVAGWLRTQEAQVLAVPVETAARFPARLQVLAGWGMWNGLWHYLDKRSPAEVHLGAPPTSRPFEDIP